MNENDIEKEGNILDKKEDSEEIVLTKEKPVINFDMLYQEIKESETEASQARIETYELKGFNSMEPSIKKNNNDKRK